MSKKKKVVYFGGAFDLINWGHIKALEMAKAQGDYLIVGLNSNELIKQYKKREAVLPWYQKAYILRHIRFVDKVVKVENFSPMSLLKKYNVDVYCLGDEWETTKEKEIRYMASKKGAVKFLPRFRGTVSTSQIKKILLDEAKDNMLY